MGEYKDGALHCPAVWKAVQPRAEMPGLTACSVVTSGLGYFRTQAGYTQTPARVSQEPRVLPDMMGSFKGSLQLKSLSQWLGFD